MNERLFCLLLILFFVKGVTLNLSTTFEVKGV